MKKNTFQDVLPPDRTIRNINIPSRRAKVIEPTPVQQNQIIEPVTPLPPSPPPPFTYSYEDEPRKRSRKGIIIAGIVLLLAITFGISALFKSATITITPRNETHALNTTFTALKNASGGDLGFQIVTVNSQSEKKINATSSAQVSTKAQGTIIIYNNYTTTAQKLIATTRFSTSGGLVYRLVSPVTVPGKKTLAGKIVPGSAEAVVQADAAGQNYNIGLNDFTLPAFKGTSQYTLLYARSKTPMSGGFVGMQKVIAPDTLASIDTELTAELKASLIQNIVSQIPSNFILYPDDVSFTLSPATQTEVNADTATVQKKGTASGIIFDKGSLSRAITEKTLPDAANDLVTISNLDGLGFSYASTSVASILNGNFVSFSLSGDTHFVWTVDLNKLKADILGLSKKQAEAVIASYKTITEAWIVTRPFWNQTIPKDPNKVLMVNTPVK